MPNVDVVSTISASASVQAVPYFRSAHVGAAVYAYLKAQNDIRRVYPVRLPQKPDYPCVTFQVITEPRTHSMEGAVAPNPLVQIDCWAKDYQEAHDLASAVERAMDGFVGRMGGLLPVSACLQRERQDFYEPDVDDYRVSLDFSIWHN